MLGHVIRTVGRIAARNTSTSTVVRHRIGNSLIPARSISVSSRLLAKDDPPVEQEGQEPWIPPYDEKFNEPLEEKRNRLMYQSRKRGMLENGLLLGSFASKYLKDMSEEQLALYDRLINLPSNDWEIFYWATGKKETPEEFNNEIMDMLKEHTRNKDKESRIRLPDLN